MIKFYPPTTPTQKKHKQTWLQDTLEIVSDVEDERFSASHWRQPFP